MGYIINNKTATINCTRGNGFFSNMFEILNILHELEINSIEYNNIEINNFSKNYSKNNCNSYYDFFQSHFDKEINISKLNCGKTIESFLVMNQVETCDIFINKDKIKHTNELINKYIKPNDIILDKITYYLDNNFKGKKILGVHVRRTDHEGHGKFVEINKYISYINGIISNYDNLFIITDDNITLDLFKNVYGDKLLYVDNIIRSNNGVAIHYGNYDKYDIGEDVIIEAYILSKCKMIIGTSSNVLMFSLCNQDNSNYKMLDLDMNIEKKKDIVFYNNFHNGDLHYAREFMKDIYNKTKDKYGDFYYYHKNENNKSILFDLDDIMIKAYLPNLPDSRGIYDDGRTIFINTWIGHNGMIYLVKDCSLYSNHEMFKHIYDYLNISIDNIDNYIPTIDFSKLNNIFTQNIDSIVKIKNKNILISNGNVNSGQALNFNFADIINNISSEFKNINFICTCKNFTSTNKNVLFSDDIILKGGDDLNEISYLSTYCDIIIGRASGPYCFTHIKENLNNKNKTYISFSKQENEGVWHQASAKNIWSNNYDINNIIKIIKNELI